MYFITHPRLHQVISYMLCYNKILFQWYPCPLITKFMFPNTCCNQHVQYVGKFAIGLITLFWSRTLIELELVISFSWDKSWELFEWFSIMVFGVTAFGVTWVLRRLVSVATWLLVKKLMLVYSRTGVKVLNDKVFVLGIRWWQAASTYKNHVMLNMFPYHHAFDVYTFLRPHLLSPNPSNFVKRIKNWWMFSSIWVTGARRGSDISYFPARYPCDPLALTQNNFNGLYNFCYKKVSENNCVSGALMRKPFAWHAVIVLLLAPWSIMLVTQRRVNLCDRGLCDLISFNRRCVCKPRRNWHKSRIMGARLAWKTEFWSMILVQQLQYFSSQYTVNFGSGDTFILIARCCEKKAW